MTARTPTYLKAVFESGDIPAGSDYSDIFDSFLPITTTGKQTLDISLEITGNFTAAEIYGSNIYAASAFNGNIINVNTVSASVANFNRVNANFVSASGGLFNVIEAQKVSASAGFFNLLNSQQVSASVVNTNIINALSVSASAINIAGTYKVAGTQVVGTQQTAVVQASGGATVDAEARTALNNLITRLRTHGLIAP
jgi:hypothetical protein